MPVREAYACKQLPRAAHPDPGSGSGFRAITLEWVGGWWELRDGSRSPAIARASAKAQRLRGWFLPPASRKTLGSPLTETTGFQGAAFSRRALRTRRRSGLGNSTVKNVRP